MNKNTVSYKQILLSLLSLFYGLVASATVYQVSVKGDDHNPGTKKRPLRTIMAAATLAMPGDTIFVHHGIYREQVNPPRGGTSAEKRITYLAAPGERVVITGSEQVSGWQRAGGNAWQITRSNTFFGHFNPYSDLIHGDWFNDRGRLHHTGAVYLNGDWLPEAENKQILFSESQSPMWFGEVNAENTVITARFGKGVNPNKQLTEINARQKVFYPEKTGINYITLKGFILRDAATNWAPPTAEQMGLIGTNWSKGWIIEDNDIAYSRCSGISLGKYGDPYDNTSANSAEGYVATVKRALADGWSKENIGGHLVRNNTVSHCEQAGIVGSLGCAFSAITGNTVHDIWVQRLFAGAEMSGIKFHGAVDVTISNNHVYRARRGLWLDWMAQGTRVTGNVFNNNDQDIFCEVDHGPFLLEGNFLLSQDSFVDGSGGGAMIANVFAGTIDRGPQDRQTPYFKPHSTVLAGIAPVQEADMRFYNNLFLGPDTVLTANFKGLAIKAAGNLFDAKAVISYKNDQVFFSVSSGFPSPLTVTNAMLGKAVVPDCAFENPDGSAIVPGIDLLLTMQPGKTYALSHEKNMAGKPLPLRALNTNTAITEHDPSVKAKDAEIKKTIIDPAGGTPDWAVLKQTITQKYDVITADRTVTKAKIYYYYSKDWPCFCDAIIRYTENWELAGDHPLLSNNARMILEHSLDPAQLEAALRWAEVAGDKDTYQSLSDKLAGL